MQVYLEVAQSASEVERKVALRLLGQVDKECLSSEEHAEVSKAFSSLLGRIGKLHMVASPKTMNAVNKFYNVLTEIFEGLVPDEDFNANVPPTMSPVFREVEERDIPAQIGRFEKARILLLWSMREDLGYSKKDLLKARA